MAASQILYNDIAERMAVVKADFEQGRSKYYDGALDALGQIMWQMVRAFEVDNPNFKRDKFIRACQNMKGN